MNDSFKFDQINTKVRSIATECTKLLRNHCLLENGPQGLQYKLCTRTIASNYWIMLPITIILVSLAHVHSLLDPSLLSIFSLYTMLQPPNIIMITTRLMPLHAGHFPPIKLCQLHAKLLGGGGGVSLTAPSHQADRSHPALVAYSVEVYLPLVKLMQKYLTVTILTWPGN